MNSRKKMLIGLISLIILSFLIHYEFNDNNCAGCDPCTYKTFSDLVKINKIDSNYSVELKSIKRNKVYRLEKRIFDLKINNIEQSDTSKVFEIEGKGITNGTCVPFFIEKIKIHK